MSIIAGKNITCAVFSLIFAAGLVANSIANAQEASPMPEAPQLNEPPPDLDLSGSTSVGTATGSKIKPEDIDQLLFNEIAKELRCPTCVGLSILDSDAPFSNQIKDEVRQQLAQGKSRDEIMAFFTERYGPWILRVPPDTGINLLAWAIPTAMLALGPIVIWFFFWRRRRTVSSFGVKPAALIEREFAERITAARKSRPAKGDAK
jgi:cytochrome c-type biogenesis protein CcmH